MSMRIDTADTGYTAEARALLDSLDDSTFVSLGVLFGSDLCALGGTRHPACWEALTSAWQQLHEEERERLTHISTVSLCARNLVAGPPVGRGVAALIVPACCKMSARLRILLSARESPAFVIATHHESRTPAVAPFPRSSIPNSLQCPGLFRTPVQLR